MSVSVNFELAGQLKETVERQYFPQYLNKLELGSKSDSRVLLSQQITHDLISADHVMKGSKSDCQALLLSDDNGPIGYESAWFVMGVLMRRMTGLTRISLALSLPIYFERQI